MNLRNQDKKVGPPTTNVGRYLLFWGPFVAFAIILVSISAVWWFSWKTFDEVVRETFEHQSNSFIQNIDKKFQNYVDFLQLASRFIGTQEEEEGASLQNVSNAFLERNSDLRSIFRIAIVEAGEQTETIGGYQIFPPSDRQVRKVISHVFNPLITQKMVGFDLTSVQELSLLLERAEQTNAPVLSNQLSLPIVSWSRGEMLLLVPFGDAQLKAKGFFGLSFQARDFFKNLSEDWESLAVRVVDRTDPKKPQFLFESFEKTAAEVKSPGPQHEALLLSLGGRSIELEIWGAEGGAAGRRAAFNVIMLIFGALFSLGGAFLVRYGAVALKNNHRRNQELTEQLEFEKTVIQTVFDASFDGIISMDEEGKIIAVGKEAETTFGIIAEDVLGRGLDECILSPEERAGYQKELKRFLDTGRSSLFEGREEITALRADGRSLSVLMSVSQSSSKGKRYLTASLHDNTERIRAEDALKNRSEELRNKVAELSALNAISSIMEKSGISYEEMLQLAASAVSDAVGSDLHCGVRIIVGEQTFISREFVETSSLLQASFYVRGALQGAIELHFSDDQSAKKADRHLVEAVASRMSEACDAKLAEDALRTSEARFRDIVEIASDWFWEMDESLRFSYLSDRFFAAMGIAASEIIGKRIGEVEIFSAVDDDLAKARHNESILERKQPFRNFEYLMVRADGQQSYVRISGHPLYDDDGSFRGYRGAGTDITARKRADEMIREANTALEVRVDERTRELKAEIAEREKAEAALRYSEKRFKDVAEASSDWIWETDSNHRLSHLSERIADMMDVDLELLIGKNLLETNLDISFEDGVENIRAIWEEHRAFRDVLLKVVDQSGAEHFIKASGTPIWEHDGNFAGFRGTASDITEKTHSEITLHRLSRAIEHSPSIIIITDPRGRIEYVNPRFEEITGFTFSDVLGQLPEAFQKSIDGQPGYEGIWETVSSGKEWSGIVEGERKNRESYWISLSFTSVIDEGGNVMNFIGAAEDISERREAEERVRFQASLLSQVRNAVIATGLDGSITYLNKYAKELWGITGEEAFEKNFSEFVNIGKRPEGPSPGWGRIGQDYYEGEFYAMREDGSTFPAFMTTSKITDADGRDLGFIRVILDLTERKKVDAQLVQASKLATIGEMAAGMAHELNQPINIIRMTADSGIMDIDDGIEGEEGQREVLTLISEQSRRMAEIIDHMRVLSRKDEAEQELFRPSEAIIAVAELIDRQFETTGVSLKLDVPKEGELVKGRRVQFEQVALNLLTNARDAIEAQCRENEKTEGSIDIKVRNDKRNGAVVVTVSDTGGGIPEDALGRVFEPFYTTKAAGKGTGLGLSVSMSLINRMGGAIDVKNTKRGAEFTIVLPVSLERDVKKSRIEDIPLSQTGKKRNGHILVVDDEVEAVRILAKFLKKHGYAVTTAFDGMEALEFFQERPADLVVTDMRMPQMSGKDLIEALRENCPNLPVIAVSGQMGTEEEKYVSKMSRMKAGQRTTQKFIKKPIDLGEVLEAIETLLSGGNP